MPWQRLAGHAEDFALAQPFMARRDRATARHSNRRVRMAADPHSILARHGVLR